MVCNFPFFLDRNSEIIARPSNITTGNSTSLSVCIRHKISFITVHKANNLSILAECLLAKDCLHESYVASYKLFISSDKTSELLHKINFQS